jgi:excisionase family DNA binding protein
MEYSAVSSGDTERLADGVDEAARRVGVGRTTMRKLVRDGVIPSFTIGRRRLVTREAQAVFVRSREQAARA